MQFGRRVHSNTTLKGGEGRMEIEYLKQNKTKKLNYVQVSQLFSSKIVVLKHITEFSYELLNFNWHLEKKCFPNFAASIPAQNSSWSQLNLCPFSMMEIYRFN